MIRKLIAPVVLAGAVFTLTACERTPVTIVTSARTGDVIHVGSAVRWDVDMGAVIDGREQESKRALCESWGGTFIWDQTVNPICYDIEGMN